jgi:hypothetical protein
VKEGDNLPSHDAMDTILPEYQYIFMDPPGGYPQAGPSTARRPPQKQITDGYENNSSNIKCCQIILVLKGPLGPWPWYHELVLGDGATIHNLVLV